MALCVLMVFVITLGWYVPQGEAQEENVLRVARQQQKYLIKSNAVTLEWSRIINAAEYQIAYYNAQGEFIELERIEAQDVSLMQYEVTNLLPGYVYTFILRAYDVADDELTTDSNIYKVQAITRVTNFNAFRINETITENQTEVGTNPGIRVSWDRLIQAADPVSYVQSVDYEINVRKSKSATADTVERFYIEYEDGNYTLNRWGGNSFELVDSSLYNLQVTDENIRFEWTKEADDNSGIGKPSALRAGAIYYMQIYPRFSEGNFEHTRYVESELQQEFITTYLQVKLERHGANNAMMTAYRVRNDGTFVAFPNFLYEFWVGPDQNNLTRAYFEREEDSAGITEQYVEAFLANTANFLNYYMVTATADEMLEGIPIELRSQLLHVNLSGVEATLPPMPENLEVVRTVLDADSKVPIVTLRWDKPDNYEQMIEQSDNLDYRYYLFLNSAIEDLYNEIGQPITEILTNHKGEVLGEYPIKYRKAKWVSITNEGLKVIDANQVRDGELYTGKERIEYEFRGQGLFEESDDNNGYPDTLLLNKVYFLKMYTERLEQDSSMTSNYTLPIAFTTPRYRENKPPLPQLLHVEEVGVDYAKLAWGRVDIRAGDYFPEEEGLPTVHYEVTVSKKRDREEVEAGDLGQYGAGKYGDFEEWIYKVTSDGKMLIRSHDGTIEEVDIDSDNPLIEFSTYDQGRKREARINGDDPQYLQKPLEANTTYYMIVRTKIEVDGEEPKYSAYSQTLSATTLRKGIEGPGDGEKHPLAPDDFAVAKDADGNLMVESYRAFLTWRDNNTPLGAIYPNAQIEYELLRTEVSIENAVDWNGDPATLDEAQYKPYVFEHADILDAYNVQNKNFIFEAAELQANTVYFFSIRAKRTVLPEEGEEDTVLYSEWITVPVTTLILEPPTLLSVLEAEEDDFTHGNFNIYHELKITWRGLKHLNQEGQVQYQYEIAIRAEDEEDYREIRTGTQYSDISTRNMERWQTTNLLGTNYEWYSAYITGLGSNTRYYIKIRTVDVGGDTVSKYTGTISARTEFSAEDYEEEERKHDNDAVFLDSINRYRDTLYWVYEDIERSDSIYYRIKMRASKTIHYLRNDGQPEFVIDFTKAQEKATHKRAAFTVDIPVKLIEVLDETGKTLVLSTLNGDFIFRPGVLDVHRTASITEMMARKENQSSVEDVYVAITLEDLKDSSAYRPAQGRALVSDITSLKGVTKAFGITDDEFEQRIHDMLYGKDGTAGTSGLIYEKRRELESINPELTETEKEVERLLDEIERELGQYIKEIIESRNYIKYASTLKDIPRPLLAQLNYRHNTMDTNASIAPHKIIGSGRNWVKLLGQNHIVQQISRCEINQIDGIKLAAIKTTSMFFDLPGHEYQEELQYMINRYDLAAILAVSAYFRPNEAITIQEAILIFERVAEQYRKPSYNPNIAIRAKAYGLDKALNLNRLQDSLIKEQAAFMGMQLYTLYTHTNIDDLIPSRNVIITDEQHIRAHLLKAVRLSVDMQILKTENQRFRPKQEITRATYIVMLKRILDKLEIE